MILQKIDSLVEEVVFERGTRSRPGQPVVRKADGLPVPNYTEMGGPAGILLEMAARGFSFKITRGHCDDCFAVRFAKDGEEHRHDSPYLGLAASVAALKALATGKNKKKLEALLELEVESGN